MPKQRLRVEQIADVTVVYFLDKRILDEPTIEVIAEQLFSLVDQDGRRKLLLNFSNVEYLSSAALGKLINLHNKLDAGQGKLAMCNVFAQILEVLAVTKFDKIFKIFPDEEAAMAGLG
jgi:anti-sigma B factor antagonist